MLGTFESHHWLDSNGKPAGGATYGPGLSISWQNGPLGRGEDRTAPNGAFVETVLAAAKDRIGFYQSGEFACQENADAIAAIEVALKRLDDRTKSREARNVEGTHSV